MDMILISDSKLKVMLSSADMEEFEISCDTIDYDNTETRRALWSILDLAKHKTGFDAAKRRVSIQVYPSRGGGCEMFVTQLALPPGDRSGAEKRKREPVPLARVCRSQGVYRFGSISGMLSACSALYRMSYPGRSSAYSDRDRDTAFLVLDESEGKYAFLTEYGGVRMFSPVCEYIAEHCVPLCENDAVERLSALA